MCSSSDGAERCGLLICGWEVLMKLNSTQEVDVYGSVLRARSQNPAFIKKTVSEKEVMAN